MSGSINLFVPINGTGYGTHGYHWARNMVHRLARRNVRAVVVPRGRHDRPELARQHPDPLDTGLLEAIKNLDEIVFDDPGICLWHAHDMSQFCGGTRIGYTVWETSELSAHEVHHLSQLSHVAVPTRWHRDILLSVRDEDGEPPWPERNVLVWPEGVDTMTFTPSSQEGPVGDLADREAFTFANIGKWERRKGQRQLITALGDVARDTLGENRRIRLLAAWDNPWMRNDRWSQEIESACAAGGFARPKPVWGRKGGDQMYFATSHVQNPDVSIEIRTNLKDVSAVKEIYDAADAGVFPHYAEGWGLSICEIMAMGKPVAVTKWGAPLEYLRDGEYFPIEEGEMGQAYDGLFFHGNKGDWFQVRASCIAREMLSMLEAKPKDLAEIGRLGAQRMHNDFTWQLSAEKTVASLEECGIL